MANRILLTYLTLTAFVLVILVVPLGITYRDRQIADLQARIQGDAVALASFGEDDLERGADPSSDLTTLAESYADRSGGRVVVVDSDGFGVLDTAPPGDGASVRDFASRPEIASALEGEVAIGTRDSETLGSNLLFVAVPVASGGVVHGAVRVTYPTSTVDARVRRNWLTLAGISAVTLAVAAVAGVALAAWVTRPVRRLEVATAALGQGALDTRTAADQGPPEVRRLATAVNEMAARLEELVGSQEAFVADASHQLRTPLTALRLRLELLEGGLPPGRGEADVAAALVEVGRLTRLVDGLLALAHAERRGASATAEDVDLADIVRERAEAWQPVADEEGVALLVEARSVAARATPDRLAQVLDNLVANALDVSSSDGAITLSTSDGPDGPELHVSDRGPGLPAGERDRAFDRFWSGRSEGRRLGGTGLGLAIVRKLVEADGGIVELRARPGGGIDATVVLPAGGQSGNIPRRGSSV